MGGLVVPNSFARGRTSR